MPPELILYLSKYGYVAIFVLVFLQEVGAPNPIPNELVLLYSGYLTFTGILQIPFVMLTAILADFTGSIILHTVFYYSGTYFFEHKPRWLPIPVKAIFKLKNQISKNGLWGIYIGRLTPFIRGYTSVIAGLLQIRSGIFMPIAFYTAITWATFYVFAGKLLGPYWSHIVPNIGAFKYSVLLVLVSIITIMIIRSYKKNSTIHKESG